MINDGDIDPTLPRAKMRDLQTMSVQELKQYSEDLAQEIARAEAMIQQKQAHKIGLEALFGKQKE